MICPSSTPRRLYFKMHEAPAAAAAFSHYAVCAWRKPSFRHLHWNESAAGAKKADASAAPQNFYWGNWHHWIWKDQPQDIYWNFWYYMEQWEALLAETLSQTFAVWCSSFLVLKPVQMGSLFQNTWEKNQVKECLLPFTFHARSTDEKSESYNHLSQTLKKALCSISCKNHRYHVQHNPSQLR